MKKFANWQAEIWCAGSNRSIPKREAGAVPVAYDMKGRTAVVTGEAKGIGRTIAMRLFEAGAQVAVWDIAQSEIAGIHGQLVDVT